MTTCPDRSGLRTILAAMDAHADDRAHLGGGRSERNERSVGKRFAREQEAGRDVITCQPVVLLDELVSGHAERQHIQDVMNGESRTSDTRLPGHDAWIEADSIEKLLLAHCLPPCIERATALTSP